MKVKQENTATLSVMLPANIKKKFLILAARRETKASTWVREMILKELGIVDESAIKSVSSADAGPQS